MTTQTALLKLKNAFRSNYAIIGILIGVALVSLSIGPFQNPDTTWEYKAATGVLTWGMPFTEVRGSMINQPPLGFYAEGLFLWVFGVSIQTGTVLITLFGLGCTLLVYAIGSTLYGKKTGLVAAALFALTPWQLVLSNSFLIDTQCLFLSLCALYVGILAFRGNSNKLLAISGALFALAFYTKLFAVFTLIPLLLFYLYYQHRNLRRLPVTLAIFFVPLALATLVWYTVDYYMMPSWLPSGLGYMFVHSDFGDLNAPGVVPSYGFISTFLLDHALGYFFVAAAALSLIIGFVFRKQLSKQFASYDAILLVPILVIVGLTMYLGVALNLKVPYTSAVKYIYQTLPFFSLAAASLAVKSASMIKSTQTNLTKKTVFALTGVVGFGLVLAALLANMYAANQLSMSPFIIFQVQLGQLLGYSFDNAAIAAGSPLLILQYLGFGLILLSLIHPNRRFIVDSAKRLFEARKK
ncbi:MAG: ArnT family glycosyltransferase [Candidatus Bathyarchaeia archaeon]|jgi:4-amino-4-deoxy-L-arabinose transferase-like glycosyltransferase